MGLMVDGVERAIASRSLRDAVVFEITVQQEQNRYVKSISVNDSEVPVEDVLRSQEISDLDTVSMVTCSMDELIEDTMQSALEFTPTLNGALRSAVRHLRVGAFGEGAGLFADSIDGIHWTASVLQNLSMIHPGPSQVHDLFESFEKAFPPLVEAWQNEDLVLVADLIEYELLPILEAWEQTAVLFHDQMKWEKLKQGTLPQ